MAIHGLNRRTGFSEIKPKLTGNHLGIFQTVASLCICGGVTLYIRTGARATRLRSCMRGARRMARINFACTVLYSCRLHFLQHVCVSQLWLTALGEFQTCSQGMHIESGCDTWSYDGFVTFYLQFM